MAMRNARDTGTYPQSLIDDPDFLREIVERAEQALLGTEMLAHLGAEPGVAERPHVAQNCQTFDDSRCPHCLKNEPIIGYSYCINELRFR